MSIPQETRRESYHEVLPKISARHQQIIGLLEIKPMTADELTEALLIMRHITRYDRNCVSPRLTELASIDKVEVVGKRMGTQGRMQSVWAIKEAEDGSNQ